MADAANYLGSLAGLSAASRAHHISAVRSFLMYCQGQGIIPRTPLDALKRPRVALTSDDTLIWARTRRRGCCGPLRGSRCGATPPARPYC